MIATTGPLVLMLIAVLLFALVTMFCWRAGLFEGNDLGLGTLFAVLFYAGGWVIPTLAMWAVWATWLRA